MRNSLPRWGGVSSTKLAELEESLKTVQEELAAAPLKYAPPVGTYLYSKNTWTGTTWIQVVEGTYLTAAGSTYASGNNYGSNSVTLNTNHLPAHTHTGPSHTHTMAHTHAVTGTAAAAGNGQTGASSAANTGASGTGDTGSTGKSAAFNNMPKSIAIPLWTRTS